jgi:NitT/TauT family transport system substrate-binding protein
MRTAEGAKAALGGTYPATSLSMQGDYVNAHKDTVQKLVNAYVATLKWIAGHSAMEIAEQMPPDYYAGVGVGGPRLGSPEGEGRSTTARA